MDGQVGRDPNIIHNVEHVFGFPENDKEIRKLRDHIVSECVELQMSPSYLGKKWGCSADTIRQWVKKAGKVLPKTYKKTKSDI